MEPETIGYCRRCGQPVYESGTNERHGYYGIQPAESQLICTDKCGELDPDEIAQDQDQALDAIAREGENGGEKESAGAQGRGEG